MPKVIISRKAQRDFEEIYAFSVEFFGRNQAEIYAEMIHTKIQIIAENPSFGTEYANVRDGVRRYECESHAIYYEATANGIRVLRILHGRMDPARHMT